MDPSRRNFLFATAAAPVMAQETKARPAPDRAPLREALVRGCRWITDIAQMKSDARTIEKNSRNLEHKHWKGSIRGEYRAADKAWDFFGPMWHTGQAVKALVLAAKVLKDERLLSAAKLSAEFIGTERVQSKSHPHHGLVFAFEDKGDEINTAGVLECVDGLFHLSDATRDPRYAGWALAAADWVARHGYAGEGLFRDSFSVKTWKYMASTISAERAGRPLNDDAIMLTAYQRTRNERFRKIFFAVADRLLKDEEPAGNWINYYPADPKRNTIHPRHAYWWGHPMVAAYRESRNEKYLECARRAGAWYIGAMRSDGGLFRATSREFTTPSFGHATSGIACAAILWIDLFKETGEQRWLDAIDRSLGYCMMMQFRNASDPNLEGAILERVLPPNGSDRSPYHLRDLGTIFFVQAASRLLAMEAQRG